MVSHSDDLLLPDGHSHRCAHSASKLRFRPAGYCSVMYCSAAHAVLPSPDTLSSGCRLSTSRVLLCDVLWCRTEQYPLGYFWLPYSGLRYSSGCLANTLVHSRCSPRWPLVPCRSCPHHTRAARAATTTANRTVRCDFVILITFPAAKPAKNAQIAIARRSAEPWSRPLSARRSRSVRATAARWPSKRPPWRQQHQR